MNKYRKMIYNKSKSRSHYYVVYYEYQMNTAMRK